jgi:hypothetical protein
MIVQLQTLQSWKWSGSGSGLTIGKLSTSLGMSIIHLTSLIRFHKISSIPSLWCGLFKLCVRSNLWHRSHVSKLCVGLNYVIKLSLEWPIFLFLLFVSVLAIFHTFGTTSKHPQPPPLVGWVPYPWFISTGTPLRVKKIQQLKKKRKGKEKEKEKKHVLWQKWSVPQPRGSCGTWKLW